MSTEPSQPPEPVTADSAPPESGRHEIAWWLFVAPLVLILLPLVLCTSVLGNDYPLHLGRLAVYLHQNQPLYHDAYRFKMVPIPNLGFDLVVAFFGQLMPVVAAGKAFTALTILLQATGAIALGYAVHRRLTAAALILPALVYNLVFSWGFMGYLLGIGLALWGVALYLLLEERSFWVRVLVLVPIAIAVYFCHLASFGLMLATLVFLEISALGIDPQHRLGPRLKGAAVVAVSSVVPAFIHLFLSPIGSSVGTRMQSPAQWLGDLNSLLNPYRTPGLSLVHDSVLLGVLVLLVLGKLKIERRLGWTALGLLILYLATPFELYGSAFANLRLIAFVAFVFFASLRSAPGKPATARVIAVAAMAITAAQAFFITRLWQAYGADREQMLAGVAQAPPGTLVISIEKPLAKVAQEEAGIGRKILSRIIKDEPFWHPPTDHATDEVGVVGEYLPIQLYMIPGKQPVELSDPYLDLYFRINDTLEKDLWRMSLARFKALSAADKKRVYADMLFNPIQAYPDTVEQVGDLLAFADREYRQIRARSGVYPTAGTYVVYLHRLGPESNPLPALLKPVSEGRVYSVYELKREAAAKRPTPEADAVR